MTRRRAGDLLWLLLFSLLPTACSLSENGARAALPATGTVRGWSAVGEAEVFSSDNLYDLVDGQADAFFAYAFEEVEVQSYEDSNGGAVRVEIWEMETAADAYGLFTTYRSGYRVAVGSGGDSDPGRRLDFWQNRFFVRISSVSSLDDDTLHAFAEMVSSALPAGGEPPPLVARLPRAGLVEDSEIFFHQEISIQDYLWLGGQNLLALGAETNGVLARYEVEGEVATVLLLQYPDSKATSSAHESLRESEFGSLVASEVKANLLVAAFGPVSETEAKRLLMSVLKTD